MKRVLVIASMIVAVLAIGGARAYFTAQTEVKDNVIKAGSVSMSVEPTSAALSIDPAAPGETITRSLDVNNTGALTVEVTTTAAKKAGYTDLWTALTCRVTHDGVELYSGPISAMRTAPVRIAPDQKATLRYAVSLPADAGNDLQGDYVRASLYIDAEQAR
jgi:predicted ribosomally synthesized peptide with SipW-like signal peptide